MVIGFLAPDGTFYKCNSQEHLYKADRICNKLGYDDRAGYAQDRLLYFGYIIFRGRSAYMEPYNNDKDHSPENLSFRETD